MPVRAVVGLQYGDEGKGRTVDMLARESDMVVRFQGGPNAGHRVVNNQGTFDLHQVPAGIFYDNVTCLAGPGMVIDLQKLVRELDMLQARAVSTGKLVVAERAHAVLPDHRLADRLAEQRRGSEAIGTTLSGVGPCYADKASRDGLQVGGLLYVLQSEGHEAVTSLLARRMTATCRSFGEDPTPYLDGISGYVAALVALADRVVDSRTMVRRALRDDRSLLLEGQLGAMRDIDAGIYPYVTSSNPTPAGAFAGAGIPVNTPIGVLGVAKAYTTAVGAGPMPTELDGVVGERLREVGGEYGVTTGRPRRCGWFDAVAVRQAVADGGVGGLVLTKLDVLTGLEHIRVCTGYELDGHKLDSVPLTPHYRRVEPVYETHPGWHRDLGDIRSFDALPPQARAYARRIEQLVRAPLMIISVGPAREQAVAVE